MLGFFYKLPRTLGQCFWGYNLIWHAVAIGLTYLLVTSGFDWLYSLFTRDSLASAILFPVAAMGGLALIITPFVVYGYGLLNKNTRIVNTAYALGQAGLIGLFVSFFYKAFTGRMQPQFFHTQTIVDISGNFRFGFMRGGVFWGWPSTHTTVAFAMAVTLATLYPQNKISQYGGWLCALSIGLGASMSFHWLSECSAGVIFGSIIGTAVANNFRERYVRLASQSVLD